MATVNIDSSELKKMATYVAETQPLIEKSARQEQLLAEKAEEAVEILAKQGLLSPHLKAAKAKEFASNPVSILDALQKTASVTRAETIGSPDKDSVKAAGAKGSEADSAFAARLMGNS
ncbi:MAG: hypothetical protein D0530_04905 [Methylococcales bacterium]|nr:MAG: hypothetical protein D0530_04905 [Methylococcales bacterium]